MSDDREAALPEAPDVKARREAMAASYLEVVRDLLVDAMIAHGDGDLERHQALGEQAEELLRQLAHRDVRLMVYMLLAGQVIDILQAGDELGPPSPRCEWCKLPADGSLPVPLPEIRELTR